MPKSRPPYPAEFRQQIIELAQAGRSPADLAREFGPRSQTIINWLAQAARDAGKPLPGKEGLSSAEREELARLRRENRQLKMERDILANRPRGPRLLVGPETAGRYTGCASGQRPQVFWWLASP